MEIYIALLEKGEYYEQPDVKLIGAFEFHVVALTAVNDFINTHCPGWVLTGGDNRFKLLRTSKQGEHGDWDDYGYIYIHKIPIDEMINVDALDVNGA